jgi:hypothetical protein
MIDAFSYLSVLLSIIIGLAITQVLQGYRGLLLARGRTALSAPVLIWSGLILLFATQAWWASFGLQDRAEWDFLGFAIVLLQMIMLYMLSALVFPEFGPDDRLDLAEHFARHRKIFFGFLLGMLAVSIAKDLILAHRLPTPSNLAFHAMFMAVAAVGMVARSARVQLWLALFAVAAFVAYVSLLFASLGNSA